MNNLTQESSYKLKFKILFTYDYYYKLVKLIVEIKYIFLFEYLIRVHKHRPNE